MGGESTRSTLRGRLRNGEKIEVKGTWRRHLEH
jgi:hypothetical protein